MNFAHQRIWRNWDLYVDVNSPHYFTERFHQFQIMPEIRYNWFVPRDGTSVFSGVGFGLNYLHQNVGEFGDIIPSRKGASLAYQVWIFGLHGKLVENLVLRLCFGFGTRGFLEFGLGYQF
jgi:hypothetical protein